MDLIPLEEVVENIVQLMFVLHEIVQDWLLESLADQLELDQELLDTIFIKQVLIENNQPNKLFSYDKHKMDQ